MESKSYTTEISKSYFEEVEFNQKFISFALKQNHFSMSEMFENDITPNFTKEEKLKLLQLLDFETYYYFSNTKPQREQLFLFLTRCMHRHSTNLFLFEETWNLILRFGLGVKLQRDEGFNSQTLAWIFQTIKTNERVFDVAYRQLCVLMSRNNYADPIRPALLTMCDRILNGLI